MSATGVYFDENAVYACEEHGVVSPAQIPDPSSPQTSSVTLAHISLIEEVRWKAKYMI